MSRRLLSHLNSNIICAVSIKTTGYTPFYHDLVSIAIVPLNGVFGINKDYIPFCLDIVPNRPENIDWDLKNAITMESNSVNKNIDTEDIITSRSRLSKIAADGMDSFKAAELLEAWFEKLNLKEKKKIVPLAYNWKFSAPFILDWLAGPLNFDYFFDSRYRDIATIACFLNDYEDWRNRPVPFPKVTKKYLCSQLKIEHDHRDDCVADCLIIREIYLSMLKETSVKPLVEE